ncbi:hypothetical protein B0H13DRAFT_2343481 [Mycena leptocephala]|nr:hypothetical protein B0H13DRAFT_2343481 [Mycena leptocephala]
MSGLSSTQTNARAHRNGSACSAAACNGASHWVDQVLYLNQHWRPMQAYAHHVDAWVEGCDKLKIPIKAKEEQEVSMRIAYFQSINVVENEQLRAIVLMLRAELKDSGILHRSKIRSRIMEVWDDHLNTLQHEMATQSLGILLQRSERLFVHPLYGVNIIFSEVLKALQQKDLQLLQDVDARWSSTLLMIDHAILLREAIDKYNVHKTCRSEATAGAS